MVVKPVLGATVGLQSVALLGESMKLVPRNINWTSRKVRRVKPVSPKPFVKGAVNIMVGTSLLRPTANLVNQL